MFLFTVINGLHPLRKLYDQLWAPATPTEETTDRIIALLNQLYANASYEVTAETPASDGSPQTVQLSIRPLNILKDNYDAIQVYVHSFNEKNADFSYADLTEEAYYDTYLDGTDHP